MNPTHTQTHAVEQFQCLAAECPDTCCTGWRMQLAAETIDHYKQHAPELLDAVAADGDDYLMKHDDSGACVKLEQGLCAIQRDYGGAMLGDACYFFPRITRALGTSLMTTMTLGCPEAARLMLYAPDAFALGEHEEVRLPYSLRNYLPKELDEAAGLAIHAAFMALAGDEAVSPARSILRISAVARALEMQPLAAWPEAVPFYAASADARVPNAELSPADPFNLAHALQGLVAASELQPPRLTSIIDSIATMLGVTFAPNGGIVVADHAAELGVRVLSIMRQQAISLQPVLRRYLEAQISESLFPFAGLGGSLSERITIIGVRYATARLALATLGEAPAQEDVVRIVQTLSRFSDHLADPALSLSIYRETGWVREARLRALLGE